MAWEITQEFRGFLESLDFSDLEHGKRDCVVAMLRELKHPSHFLELRDGKKIKSLTELNKALSEMNNSTFLFHHSKEKSDFSKWVGESIGDRELARQLDNARNRQHASRLAENRLQGYKKKLGLDLK